VTEAGEGGHDAHDQPAAGHEAAGHDGQEKQKGHQEHKHKHGHGHGHAPAGGGGPSAPLWMLSFADMMTNLLCFFILLSAFAQKQEGVLLEDGLGSIRQALLATKLPGAVDGRKNPLQFNAGKVVARTAGAVNAKTLVEADGRILDANRDTLRKIVAESLAAQGASTLPMPLLFEADATALSPGHAAFLDEVAKYLAAGRYRIRVDGYAFEEGSGRDAAGWLLSEARARSAREHLVRAGIAGSRITCVGHGLLEYGAATKAGAPESAQNRFGRRAVLITFLD
jgi:flagellar motor protein MotB